MKEYLFVYSIPFAASLVVTLLLTPIVREIARKVGMVDKPDPRRINKVPIPRGGGFAIVLGVLVPYAAFHFITGRPWIQGIADAAAYKMAALSFAIAILGLIDDRYSIRPRTKLCGQVFIAFLAWWWAGLGFSGLWPAIPAWADCLLTVFWITGAVNAFNLIDGLDGLAAGLALIAVIGMAGGIFFSRNPQMTLFYFALAGGLVGFLRYNYNPASVFLGDCGSMFLGFVVGTMPLVSNAPNAFLVSVGVPLLAMGVPIFDTTLAILRRTLRRLLAQKGAKAGEVMSADSDHLHHRILRATGLNQRKTAWILYGLAIALVAVGLVAMFLESHAAGFWLAAISVAAVVIFKDATIELFDAGRLLNSVAHAHDQASRHRMAVLSVPFFVFFDVFALVVAFFICVASAKLPVDEHLLRSFLPMRVVSVFVFLVLFRTYRTVWSRALGSNYFRLVLACVFGSIAGSVFIYYWPSTVAPQIAVVTVLYAAVSIVLLTFVRLVRGFVRDFFYALDCSRIRNRKDVSRILVYGAGLRYKAFRRELVRTTSANDRMIVGLLDDDVYLKGRYIGGIRICGTLADAPNVINELNVDAVVIACEVPDDWLAAVKKVLAPTGVKVTKFSFSETSV